MPHLDQTHSDQTDLDRLADDGNPLTGQLADDVVIDAENAGKSAAIAKRAGTRAIIAGRPSAGNGQARPVDAKRPFPFVHSDTSLALMQVIRDNPEEDTPRLMLADLLSESGAPEGAEYFRGSLGKWSAGRPAPQQLAAMRKQYHETLVMPKPRDVHFVGIDRGLPRLVVEYPGIDLDRLADRIPPHYCLQLVLRYTSNAVYQSALRHEIAKQVHFIQVRKIDKCDVFSLAETHCVNRSVVVMSARITLDALAVWSKYLPKAQYRRTSMRNWPQSLAWDVGGAQQYL